MTIKDYIWYEKYRPKKLNDMSLPDTVRRQMKKHIRAKEIPHLLFHGPPGSGKTTLAHILISSIPCRALVLNASSDDRGIGTIKGKVKDFAGSQPLPGQIKIVFLDEADGLTPDAQMALKNTIETFSKTCRFILTANNLHRIIDPIKSRPIIYEFSQIDKEEIGNHLTDILDAEDVDYEAEDVEEIVERFYPDVRTIVNNLQAASSSGELDLADVFMFNVNPGEVMELISHGDLKTIREKINGVPDFTFIYRYIFDEYLPELDTDAGVDFSASVVKHLYQDALVADRMLNFLGFCVDAMDILEVSEIKF